MAKLAVHVTPRSSKNAVVGREGDEVRVKVSAPPDGGKANKAVCKVVADALGLPKSAVEVASGHTSRHKRLSISCDQSIADSWFDQLPPV